MSLIMVLSTPKAIVLAAESRMTYKLAIDNSIVKYEDNKEMKLYWFEEYNVGIAHCGNARMFSDKGSACVNIALMWFGIRKLNKGDTAKSIADKLNKYIKEIEHIGTHFFIVGFENEIPQVYRVNSKGVELVNKNNVYGCWIDGICNTFDVADVYGEMDVKEAIEFAEAYFENILSKRDDESLQPEEKDVLKKCGGFVDILVIGGNESYWVKNKALSENKNILVSTDTN